MTFEKALDAHRRGAAAEAETLYRAVLSEGDHPAALANLGSLVRAAGRLSEAEALYRQALKSDPGRWSPTLNLANLLLATGRLAEAAALYRTIADASPEVRVNLACALLALGEDAEGWAHYQARPERDKALSVPLSFPEWQGEPLAGRSILIRPEQGLGDQILAARYVAGLGAERVTLYATAPLKRLLSQLPATVRLIGREAQPIEPHDYWSLPLSLPRWAAASHPPYLQAAPKASGARIGVAWRGNPLPDPARSIPDADAAELLALPGAVSLHPEDTGAGDFQDTAELIAGLDLVISIDTSIAHLAGAMGKPVCVLLHHQAYDWRWRSVRPFYPTARLFRQSSQGDWAAPIAAARSAFAV